jgi:hypothetical protein
MDLFGLLLLMGVGAGGVFRLYQKISRGIERKKRVIQHPLRPMSDVHGNQAIRVKGEITATTSPLIAPFSGRPCVCFEVLVEEYSKDNEERPWVTLAQDTLRQNFMLTQGAEKALILVQYAEMQLTTDEQQSTMRRAPQRVQDFLEKHGALITAGNKTIRFSEGALYVGEQAVASGFARREADLQSDSAGYRAQATRLLYQHQDDYPLYISNDPSTFR